MLSSAYPCSIDVTIKLTTANFTESDPLSKKKMCNSHRVFGTQNEIFSSQLVQPTFHLISTTYFNAVIYFTSPYLTNIYAHLER